jgi:hypothetical protein
MGLLSKIQSRLELHRLEKKYTTRRKAGQTAPVAQYVDGEYFYQTPPSHSSDPNQQTPQLISSSSTFVASHGPQPNYGPPAVIFPSDPNSHPPSPWTNPTLNSYHNHNPSNNSFSFSNPASATTKHSSWHSSLTPTSNTSARNSSLTTTTARTSTAGESPMAISRNSKGQTWEPPKQGWGGDGTDAFRCDKREFRFDVERDRRSVGRVD